MKPKLPLILGRTFCTSAPLQPYDTFVGDAIGHLFAAVPGETEAVSREKADYLVNNINKYGDD